MNYRHRASTKFDCILLTILAGFLLTLATTSISFAATGEYQGNGISFEYPANYQLSTTSKKSGESILLKKGSDSISIQVMKNVLIDGFDTIVINQINKKFGEKGQIINNAKKETKSIPLKVRGESNPLNIDAVKYSHTVTITKNEITIKLQQTMFFFSYGEHGYMINFTRVNSKYSDLVTVLSSFTFDTKEPVENDAKAGVY